MPCLPSSGDFPTNKPARTTVTVASLNAPELVIEITVIAGIPD